MKNKYGIEEEIYKEMLMIFKEVTQVSQVILFGSRAKGTYKPTSDIDLAVELTEDSKKLLLIRKLDEMRCALKFDVINRKQIKNEQLIHDIDTEGVVIYEKNG